MGFFKLLVKTYLFFVGIIPNNRSKEKYLLSGIITCNIILIIGIIVGVFATEDGGYKTETLSHLFSILFVFGIRCTSYMNREILVKVSQKLCGNFNILLENDVTSVAEKKVKRALWPMSIFISFLIVSVSVPILRSIFQDIDYNNPDLYAIPYWFAHGEVTSLVEYLAIIISLNFLSMIDIITFWCFTIFLVSVISTFMFHLNEINDRIEKRMNSEWKVINGSENCKPVMLVRPVSNEDERIIELQYLIRYQQAFYSYIREFMEYLQWPFSLMLAWFTFTTVLVTFAFFQVTDNAAFIVRIVALNGNLLVAFFIYCNVAEITSHQGEILLDSFYTMQWYALAPKQRKLLIIAMAHCHKKFNIKAFGMYNINLSLHVRVLKIVFSMVNILLIVDKK